MSICVRTHWVLWAHESSLWHPDFDLRLSTGEQILFELCLTLPKQRDPSDMHCEIPCLATWDTWEMDFHIICCMHRLDTHCCSLYS